MAANARVILQEMQDNGWSLTKDRVSRYQHALGYAAGMDLTDTLDDWSALRAILEELSGLSEEELKSPNSGPGRIPRVDNLRTLFRFVVKTCLERPSVQAQGDRSYEEVLRDRHGDKQLAEGGS